MFKITINCLKLPLMYTHDDTECFCTYCGNTNLLNDHEMCEYCYDDNSISYYCYLCNNTYNYHNIKNPCIIYINASNLIKKFFKYYI